MGLGRTDNREYQQDSSETEETGIKFNDKIVKPVDTQTSFDGFSGKLAQGMNDENPDISALSIEYKGTLDNSIRNYEEANKDNDRKLDDSMKDYENGYKNTEETPNKTEENLQKENVFSDDSSRTSEMANEMSKQADEIIKQVRSDDKGVRG